MRCSFALFFALLSSCASHNYTSKKGHKLFQEKRYEEAAMAFEQELKGAKANQMLYFLDAGMSRFRQGDYKKAIAHFLNAERLGEIKDYTSVSEEVGVLLTSDNVRGYKGEDFEKIVINLYLMLSFMALGDLDGSLVEVRKINGLLSRMIHDGKRNYKEWPLAHYISGLLWEIDRSYDNAYIAYKKVYELDPHFPEIPSSLITLARKNSDFEGLKKWTKLFPDVKKRDLMMTKRSWVVFFESGKIPKKVPRSEDPSLPYIPYSDSDVRGIQIKSASDLYVCKNNVLNLADHSRDYLEQRIHRMKLAKVAGTVTKYAAAGVVSKATKDEGLGAITFLILLLLDQADLRSWSTLPHDLFMCHFDKVPEPGLLTVDVIGPRDSILKTFTKEKPPAPKSAKFESLVLEH